MCEPCARPPTGRTSKTKNAAGQLPGPIRWVELAPAKGETVIALANEGYPSGRRSNATNPGTPNLRR
jgi:hypothetical protein